MAHESVQLAPVLVVVVVVVVVGEGKMHPLFLKFQKYLNKCECELERVLTTVRTITMNLIWQNAAAIKIRQDFEE